MTKQFNDFFDENYIRNLPFDSFETDITVLSSNSYKLVSKSFNKIVVLNKISFSNKYAIKDFINDLRQYRKVELHENILKFIGIIKQSTHGIMFIHEYANEGTLRQYLNQNFCKLNWNDKLNLAKQLVSAIKCLHESDIVHLNLNPKNIFVDKGNLKLNEFGAFQYRNKILNKFKLIQYTDPHYLENPKTYKLNKNSDIYSIGVLLWEISSECWKYDPNLRPTIQHVFKEIINIHYNYEEIITESIKDKEYKEKLISKIEYSNSTSLL
ncbi:kinase-like domain-containing protein [Gigaspora rosea]|uniref:Kinase-like domain-containing protein n=1 Tax=Gigaspora rosea TaxID=44941 RepID=A0A397W699_9GLOM|nr:kinase-like domain-containing protein [Gigaspora rosea]